MQVNIFYQKKIGHFFFFNSEVLEEVRGKGNIKKTSMHVIVMQGCDKSCSLDNYKYLEMMSLLSRTVYWGGKMSTPFSVQAAKKVAVKQRKVA